jgi:hypothetical protein
MKPLVTTEEPNEWDQLGREARFVVLGSPTVIPRPLRQSSSHRETSAVHGSAKRPAWTPVAPLVGSDSLASCSVRLRAAAER